MHLKFGHWYWGTWRWFPHTSLRVLVESLVPWVGKQDTVLLSLHSGAKVSSTQLEDLREDVKTLKLWTTVSFEDTQESDSTSRHVQALENQVHMLWCTALELIGMVNVIPRVSNMRVLDNNCFLPLLFLNSGMSSLWAKVDSLQKRFGVILLVVSLSTWRDIAIFCPHQSGQDGHPLWVMGQDALGDSS